ncbi:MAG: hypothetical protein RL322_2150 [Pseudomonadota bacterium]
MTSAGSAPSAEHPHSSVASRTATGGAQPDALQSALGLRWQDPGLLQQALTHRSFGQPHNERLEFLGDSVLNCAMARLLYQRFSALDEGDLSRLRANLVKQQALFEIAQSIQLGRFVRLGEGERRSGGPRRPSILGDTLEAVFGAVFLDAGYDAAARLIERLYAPLLSSINPETLGKDAKTLLQEVMQGRKLPLPAYSVVATHGAAHNQTFEVECSLSRLGITVTGSGTSRRGAEQAAARQALEQVKDLKP